MILILQSKLKRKNDCVVNFGHISHWIKHYSDGWVSGMRNTQDICKAITEGSRMSNCFNKQCRISSGRYVSPDEDRIIAINFDVESLSDK